MDRNAGLNPRSHFCGPLSLGPVPCGVAYIRAGDLPIWPQFERAGRLATHRCRTAIRAVLPVLGIGPGTEVLAPAYNCGSEIDALLAVGATVRMYDVTPDARVTVETILAGVTPATKAVYVIHYFGWPQDLDPIRRLCDERGLLLLEDCALSLFSRDASGWLGHWGDASFFSLMKSLGVPDGAVTLTRKPLGLAFSKSPTVPLLTECARLAKRAFLRVLSRTRLGVPRQISAGRPYSVPKVMLNGREPMPSAYRYNDEEMTDASISRVTLGTIRDIDCASIIRARRTNYFGLIGGIKDVPGVQALFPSIPDGVCPLAVPLIVSNRQDWMERLSHLGAHPTAWWSGYHPDLDFSPFPNACLLKDSILALPIHQELNSEDINFLIGCVLEASA